MFNFFKKSKEVSKPLITRCDVRTKMIVDSQLIISQNSILIEILDISVNGLGFKTKDIVNIGDTVSINPDFIKNDPQFLVNATVMNKSLLSDQKLRIGIKFDFKNNEQKQFVQQKIQEIISLYS